MESPTEKVELKDQYKMTDYDPKSRIAQFSNSAAMSSSSAFFFMRLPENVTTRDDVNSWLNQEGEDAGWIDVDIKYKLLEKARRWKEIQDGYGPDHPQVSLENANAQEKYNLTVLTEQKDLVSEFKRPNSNNPLSNNAA